MNNLVQKHLWSAQRKQWLRRPWQLCQDNEGGYATVETALTLPALLAVVALALGVSAAGAAKVQACDVARVAARAESIGTPYRAGNTVSVTVDSSDKWVKVTARKHLVGQAKLLPALTCSASALKEPELAMGIER